MNRTTTVAALAVAALTTAVLAGCTATTAPAPSRSASPGHSSGVDTASAPSTGPTTTPSQAASTPEPSCGPASGRTAAASAISRLPAPTGLPDVRWDASRADVKGYAACAALSWVTVTVPDATASSPCAILLFHRGAYLGTATKIAYPYYPDVVRTSDTTIGVTYHYPKSGDSNANLSGSTRATYTWNGTAVAMTGQTPPTP